MKNNKPQKRQIINAAGLILKAVSRVKEYIKTNVHCGEVFGPIEVIFANRVTAMY